MKKRSVLPLISTLLLSSAAFGQATVEVSSVTAESPTLDCSKTNGVVIETQVYFPTTVKQLTNPEVTVRLGIYYTDPPGNRIQVMDNDQVLKLTESPAHTDFKVACSADTFSGKVSLAAAIIAASHGAKIVQDPVRTVILAVKKKE